MRVGSWAEPPQLRLCSAVPSPAAAGALRASVSPCGYPGSIPPGQGETAFG